MGDITYPHKIINSQSQIEKRKSRPASELYIFSKNETNLPLYQETISAPVSMILQLILFLSIIVFAFNCFRFSNISSRLSK